jgi:hypothetical protein
LYRFQSLGFDRLPWLLGFLLCALLLHGFFLLFFVFQFLSPAQIGSRIPLEIEERERDTQPYHGVVTVQQDG